MLASARPDFTLCVRAWLLLLVPASQAIYHATLTHVFHLLRSNITTDDVTTTQALMWLCAVGFSPRDHRLLLDLGLVSCVAELYALSGSAGSTGTGAAGSGYAFYPSNSVYMARS